MIREERKTTNNLEDKIISFVSKEQPVHIGEIFKNLKISQTKGLNYVTSMINQGKLIYASHNQVNVI
ncbi:hypothetical protein SAMN06265379_102163 [Saccharicrinis carchari]|uniref:Uncharacterized protein n=1 Tax=Saccharicrinis carchari TaxID=1168039 RepID=A0A521BX18_SACCC|nr:hypothetical protein [Saccharicrinis carchari]SMO51752.1 hypothetical protein SAMN06265379_102163 [Saccharicrinis carchari]